MNTDCMCDRQSVVLVPQATIHSYHRIASDEYVMRNIPDVSKSQGSELGEELSSRIRVCPSVLGDSGCVVAFIYTARLYVCVAITRIYITCGCECRTYH